MKRIRYECEACGAETKATFELNEAHPARIRCEKCGGWMDARMPRPAIHFNLTRRKG